jgi:hypothetical protein
MSLLLMDLPHGRHTAASWDDIGLRFSVAARRLVPGAAVTHVVIRLRTRERARPRGGPHRSRDRRP